ncbi:hypothetical protein ACQKP1_15765 [Allorhizobium sp. NPDC080224]|uniref:hypothetical protein n=1 Tax=Allorhizobium sp. NPDC080224 TaxID=3390547 RepID=UPI003CFDE5EC
MALEIRLYIRGKSGKLENMFDAEEGYFGCCPTVGDVITKDVPPDWEPACFEVKQRYFTVDLSEWRGWTLVVEKIASKEGLAVHAEFLSSSISWERTETEENPDIDDAAFGTAMQLATQCKANKK